MQQLQKQKWILTNKKVSYFGNLKCLINNEINLYAEKGSIKSFNTEAGSVHILIDGYLMPQLNYFEEFSTREPHQLVYELYKREGLGLTNYIKGNFNLIIIDNNSFIILNDHLGIKKYFYKNEGGFFIFSSELIFVSKNCRSQLDYNNIAIYTLMHHYIDGQTFLKDIFFNQPASLVRYTDKQISFETYWQLGKLIEMQKTDIGFNEFSSFYLSLLNSYFEYFNVKKSLLSLTGGMDSRTLLAGMFNQGHKPSTFTFGNPDSGDVLVAKNLAQEYGLTHRNPNQPKPTGEWFDNLANTIVEKGNSLTNFHRSYRLDAIIQEANNEENADITFGGFLGGETIRGIFLDDYIITKFAQKFAFEQHDFKSLVYETLDKNFINKKNINIDDIYQKLIKQSYFGDIPRRHKEFYMIFKIIGETHLTQDINLYNNYHRMLVSPYMDIDYISLLFSSKQCMLFKDNTSSNQFRRINNPLLHAKLIQKMYPPLTNQLLNNNYTPREYLTSKLYYLVIRGYRKKFWKTKPSNFSYGLWYKDYIESKIDYINNDLLNEVYNLSDAIDQFKNIDDTLINKEGNLHKFTNIIMLDSFIKYYLS